MVYATNLKKTFNSKSNYLDSAKVQDNKNNPMTLFKIQQTKTKFQNLFDLVTHGQGTIRDLQHFINLLELGSILALKFEIKKSYYESYQQAYSCLSKQIQVCKKLDKASWDYDSYMHISNAINLYFKQLFLTNWGQLDEAIAIKNKSFKSTTRKLFCKGDFNHEYISTPNQG